MIRGFFIFVFCAGVMTAQYSHAMVMQDYPIVKLQALDKSTARGVIFQAKVGSTIQYGSLFIKVQACRKSPPLEKPESASFIQIWEVPLGQEKSSWIFSGWMFASSPALSAMDHPVYDVWVLDCLSSGTVGATSSEGVMSAPRADAGALEQSSGSIVADDNAEIIDLEDLESSDIEIVPAKDIQDVLDEVTQ